VSSPLITAELPPSRIVICPHCTAIAAAPVPRGLILGKTADLPLPDGWIWTPGKLPGIEGEQAIPLCADCARKWTYKRDDFHGERARARDLVDVGMAKKRGRGGS